MAHMGSKVPKNEVSGHAFLEGQKASTVETCLIGNAIAALVVCQCPSYGTIWMVKPPCIRPGSPLIRILCDTDASFNHDSYGSFQKSRALI